MNFQSIQFEVENRAARIVLNRPPLNILDVPMLKEIAEALEKIPVTTEFLVFCGAGERGFSAGAEVRDHAPDRAGAMLKAFHGVIRRIGAGEWITVAAVHGICLGGGCELATICDFVIADENATFGQPEIKLGCFPPVAATALAALVGQKHAADLILTGRNITGKEAANIGLANAVVAEVDLEHTLQETVQHLSQLSPAALAITKKAFYAWDSIHFDKGLARAEKIYFEELMKTEDAQEGIAAFMQKRKPVWKGR